MTGPVVPLPMVAASAGRSGHKWRLVQAAVYGEEHSCWLCGQYVDQRLYWQLSAARSVDHLRQLQHGGAGDDRANGRLAHRGCNSARSNRLRNLAIEDCACSYSQPCARIHPQQPRGYLALEPEDV